MEWVGALFVPAILPAAVGMASGTLLGTKVSRWGLGVAIICFAVALGIFLATRDQHSVAALALPFSLFFGLGLSGRALFNERLTALIASFAITFVGGFVGVGFLPLLAVSRTSSRSQHSVFANSGRKMSMR